MVRGGVEFCVNHVLVLLVLVERVLRVDVVMFCLDVQVSGPSVFVAMAASTSLWNISCYYLGRVDCPFVGSFCGVGELPFMTWSSWGVRLQSLDVL